ncbi:4Fe-4S binding protein [[Clostridium] asparagiforme DSM 15981]|nr:4Fe-4S binding protein [Enterocloster asparagiformis]UWO79630.1 4Fe-4S binding protein [[Clostridium] asparagiforme DSM 15981]
MLEDEEGFEYPQIDKSKCICCYQCLRVCPFKVMRIS